MAWEMLRATGKLFVDLVRIEVEPFVQDFIGPHVNKKIAERLKPDLKRREPNHQHWAGLEIGMSEKQVGKLLGLPDSINELDSISIQEGFTFDTGWSYVCRGILREHFLDGYVFFRAKRVTSYRVYYLNKSTKRWYAREAPPSDWIKERQKEGDSDELGTIL